MLQQSNSYGKLIADLYDEICEAECVKMMNRVLIYSVEIFLF